MIKNYTSSVPVDRTVSRIEAALVRGGATNILKDYASGRLSAICFTVANPQDGKIVAVRLPANPGGVYEVMRSRVKKPRRGTMDKLEEQSLRTAWKLVQDWVEVQMSLVAMRQAEFLQVFLPYVWDGRRTFYASLKEDGFKLLSEGVRERSAGG